MLEEKRRKANGDGYTIHHYLRGRMIGKGGFAKVYMCTALDTNKNYAVKVVPKANLVKTRARQKVRVDFNLKILNNVWSFLVIRNLLLCTSFSHVLCAVAN
jgi:serine/threonine protein kinase